MILGIMGGGRPPQFPHCEESGGVAHKEYYTTEELDCLAEEDAKVKHAVVVWAQSWSCER